jgi:hypothetical protein
MKLGPFWLVAFALLVSWPERSVAQVSQSDIDGLLALHNSERCMVNPTAASMPKIGWDDLLAMVAQSYADGCVLMHNPDRSTQYQALGGAGYVGENIAWGTTGFYTLVDLAQLWADEKSSWTYAPIDSMNIAGVGHYTQMIWADTLAVGCGAAPCTGNTFLVCDYAPGGNIIGDPPYAEGNGPNQACPEPEQALGLTAALGTLAALSAGRAPGARRRRA